MRLHIIPVCMSRHIIYLIFILYCSILYILGMCTTSAMTIAEDPNQFLDDSKFCLEGDGTKCLESDEGRNKREILSVASGI